jgi:glycosyltransferase involved in cell wall biosynthesis
METVAVVVATFGDMDIWKHFARRAYASVRRQTRPPDERVYYHGCANLADARNRAAHSASADWLIFLDADDELDGRYVEAMLAVDGDLRWPSTLGVFEDGTEELEPYLMPETRLIEGNHMVIGTMIRREQFLDVGGFRELPVLEDWDLWLRLVLNGGIRRPCPQAIYRYHIRSGSRNQQVDVHRHVYGEITSKYDEQWREKFG